VSALPQSDVGSATSLYERHRSRLVGFCTAQMGSRDEAEDAVQDTFIYALRALRRGVVPESETAWLFTIARNVCSSRRRNGSRRGRVVVTRDLDALQDILPARERQRDELFGLREALAAIPESQRQAILLREWQGLTYAEIAEALDLSASAVETLLFRARRSLARALERTGKAAARALNVSPALGLVRSLLEAGGAKVAAATLAAVAAGTVGGATVARQPVAPARTTVAVARAPLAPRIAPAPVRPSTKHSHPVQARSTGRGHPPAREMPSTRPAAPPADKPPSPPAAPADAARNVPDVPPPAAAGAAPAPPPPPAPPPVPTALPVAPPTPPEASPTAPSLPTALPSPPSLPPLDVSPPSLPPVTTPPPAALP
jgi:RNA polymerase sigma factor (sigma-70 family)